VDQIFDRFERLFKSWVAGDSDSRTTSSHGGSGNADFDAAMDELDDFLDRGRTESEARDRAEQARRARDDAARASAGARPAGPHPRIVAAYRSLGVPYGTPFPQVKIAYKKLLMANHPDRNSATPEQMKRSTEISAQINAAYQRLETWTSSGVVTED
jgi:hypothetical protein